MLTSHSDPTIEANFLFFPQTFFFFLFYPDSGLHSLTSAVCIIILRTAAGVYSCGLQRHNRAQTLVSQSWIKALRVKIATLTRGVIRQRNIEDIMHPNHSETTWNRNTAFWRKSWIYFVLFILKKGSLTHDFCLETSHAPADSRYSLIPCCFVCILNRGEKTLHRITSFCSLIKPIKTRVVNETLSCLFKSVGYNYGDYCTF